MGIRILTNTRPMDAIILKDKPTDDKCKDCSLIYMHNGIIRNGIRHVLVNDTANNKGCGCCSMDTQCIGKNSGICVRMFDTEKCHFEIK